MFLVFYIAMQSKIVLEGEWWRNELKMEVYVNRCKGTQTSCEIVHSQQSRHRATMSSRHSHAGGVWATGSGRKAAKRPVQIYKVVALALLRALLKGDKAVGGTCVWWESQNPADSLVSPSDALLGTPALFVKLSVKQEVFTGTWASRLVVGTEARPKSSLFYWFIWSLF